MVQSKTIDINKQYLFPANIRIIYYKSLVLVISVDTACWIVLKNEKQLEFFELLKCNPISEALGLFNGSQQDAVYVVTQIEARDFCNLKTRRTDANGMHFYLTNRCNMRCPHCYMSAGKEMEAELTTLEVKTVLTAYKNHGGREVTFSGGEVGTRKDLLEIITHSGKLGLRTNIYSNGILIDEEFIRLASPWLNKVQISVDGYSEEENSRLRGKGNFSKALKTIDCLLNNNVPTDIAITPWYDNSLETKVTEYVEFAENLKDKYAGRPFDVIFSTELLDGRELKLNRTDKDKYSKIMERVISLFSKTNVKDQIFISAHRQKQILDNCNFGCLSIAANGDVYMCSRTPSLVPIANVRTHDFEYIWEQSQKAQKKSDISQLAPCKDCELMYICGGNCRIEHFPEIAQCSDFNTLDTDYIQPRHCNQSIKEEFYELMIRVNTLLYK